MVLILLLVLVTVVGCCPQAEALNLAEQSLFAAQGTLFYAINSSWFLESTVLFSYIYVFNLTVSWFLIVWLSLNLLSYRFDQVASYTWHELVIYSMAILLQIIIAYFLF